MEKELELAKINEAYHRKQMEYFQEEIKILNGKNINNPNSDNKILNIINELCKNVKAVQIDIGEYDRFISAHSLCKELKLGVFSEGAIEEFASLGDSKRRQDAEGENK